MKPILQHLEELPEPYRSQAIKNHGNPDIALNYPHVNNYIEPSPAIDAAFDWGNSPEGFKYWSSFCGKLEAEPKPPEETLQHFNERQIHAIEYHRYMLGTRWGRSPTILEAFLDWVDSGFAEQFRNGEIGKDES